MARGIALCHHGHHANAEMGPAFGVRTPESRRVLSHQRGHDGTLLLLIARMPRNIGDRVVYVHTRVRTWEPLRRRRRPPPAFPSHEAVDEPGDEAEHDHRRDGDAYAHRGAVARRLGRR